MADLSVIIPYVQEWPQIIFTIQAVAQDLMGRVDFEIIAIDNWCSEMELQQKLIPDRGHPFLTDPTKRGRLGLYGVIPKGAQKSLSHVEAQAASIPWLKYVRYDKKLSHWNAKRVGIEVAEGKYLLFVDSHVIPERDSLYNMYNTYINYEIEINGTLHLPLTYHILENKKLIYKLRADAEGGACHYAFTPLRRNGSLMKEVPCMSTCGMMISKRIYEETGGWPTELGIYGGGENFMNYVLSVLGYQKFIYQEGCLHHHGDSRKYHWYGDDFNRNKMIAMYMAGGKDWLMRFASNCKGSVVRNKDTAYKVADVCKKQHDMIRAKEKITLDKWIEIWK